MKKIALLVLLSICAQTLVAEEKENGVTSSSELVLQVSSLPEMKLGFTERFTFPFLQGESFLTQNNNISLALTAEVSPVSLNGIVEAVWTPVAFFRFSSGGRIGSGWNIELFGGNVYGIGLNRSNAADNAEQNGQAFDGLLWKAQTGAALQADWAAVFPGDWNHVVVLSYHEINYKGYTRAKAHESWYYENDDGENCNGFNYYGNFLIGYQMPIFFKMAAFLAEMDLYLYDTPERGKWGDDKIRWTFSGIFSFTISKQIDITLLTQFRLRKNYQESNWHDLYYRNRTINSSNPFHLEFYRVAAALTYRL